MDSSAAIDLNADVGEGCGDDAALIPLVSSCNIACAAHAGDEATMNAAVALALHHHVAIGAHPGYADRANFGRAVVPLADDELFTLIFQQLTFLSGLVKAHGGQLQHVKPHGALYNLAARDGKVAATIAAAVAAFDSRLRLVGLANSALIMAGRAAGLATCSEGFIDRAYHSDGSLRDRRLPGAVHTDLEVTLAQALALARRQPLKTFDGTLLHVVADTLCIHGDTPHAAEVAQAVRATLQAADVTVRAPSVPNENAHESA